MFSARKLQPKLVMERPQTTEQVLALVLRMRVLSAEDAELAKLLEDMAVHLPVDSAPTRTGPPSAAVVARSPTRRGSNG